MILLFSGFVFQAQDVLEEKKNSVGLVDKFICVKYLYHLLKNVSSKIKLIISICFLYMHKEKNYPKLIKLKITNFSFKQKHSIISLIAITKHFYLNTKRVH